MKKQRKPPQQMLPSRKSPRLSSSSSPAAAASSSSTRTRNKPESRPGDAWALSLHVSEQPQEDNSLRRSPRFASETPPPQSRTSPSSSAPALTLTDGKNVGRRKIRSVVLSERCLRSRTVMMKRVVSERRGRGRGRGNGGETPPIEVLALTPISRNEEKCSSEGVSEKRLRSWSIQLKLNVAENADRNDESAVKSISVQLKQNDVGKADQKGGGRSEDRSGKRKKKEKKGILCCFVGEPIPGEEAQRRWKWRYDLKVRSGC